MCCSRSADAVGAADNPQRSVHSPWTMPEKNRGTNAPATERNRSMNLIRIRVIVTDPLLRRAVIVGVAVTIAGQAADHGAEYADAKRGQLLGRGVHPRRL